MALIALDPVAVELTRPESVKVKRVVFCLRKKMIAFTGTVESPAAKVRGSLLMRSTPILLSLPVVMVESLESENDAVGFTSMITCETVTESGLGLETAKSN